MLKELEKTMQIGGVQKLSLGDYPGKTSVVIFTIGCNMRCSFCHNPELVLPERFVDVIPTDEVLDFLASRVGKIDGVVISGGEPTLHRGLTDFIKKVKKMGFLVKLDTNGTTPDVLQEFLDNNLVDYVAMDIKTAPDRYIEVTNRAIDGDVIRRSIKMIKSSGVDHEFRTTIVKSLVKPGDFDEIGQLVKGSPRYALQKFRSGITLNPSFANEQTLSDDEFSELKKQMEKYVDECVIH